MSRFSIEVACVKNGQLILDAHKWSDGTPVRAFLFEDIPVQISEAEREMLLMSIASGVVEDGRDAEDVLNDMIKELEAESEQ